MSRWGSIGGLSVVLMLRSSIISDVPGSSNSSEISNELNKTSDTIVSISKAGKSSVWIYFGYEANSSKEKERKRPNIVNVLCVRNLW